MQSQAIATSGGAAVSPPLPPGDAVVTQQVKNNGVMSSVSLSSSYCCTWPRTLPFPKVGIKVSFFKVFIELCGGREELAELTTTELSDKYVKPQTESTKESYCNYLLAQRSEYVNTAKVFVSHAWKYKFLDVVEALEDHFRNAPDTVLWFDLFSNNQHAAVDLNFDWWCGTFKSAIGAFKHTVMVMAPWKDPIPLKRGWCLFELYCTVETNSKFEIAMSKSHRAQFFLDMQNGVDEQINTMLTTINAEYSECFKEEDRKQIFAVVKETVGFDKINALVFEKLRDWVVEVTELESRQHVAGTEEFLVYQSMLADLYFNQGRYDKALALFLSCYEARAGILGNKCERGHTMTYTSGIPPSYRFSAADSAVGITCRPLAAPVCPVCDLCSRTPLQNDLYFYQCKTCGCNLCMNCCTLASSQSQQADKILEAQFRLSRAHHARYESLILERRAFESKKEDFIRKQNSYADESYGIFKEKCRELFDELHFHQRVAESLYNNCLHVRGSTLGSSDPLTLDVMSSLAQLLALTDKVREYDDEERSYERAYEFYQEHIKGKTSRSVVWSSVYYDGFVDKGLPFAWYTEKRAHAESLLLQYRDIIDSHGIPDETLHLDATTKLALFYISDAAGSTKKKGLQLLRESYDQHKSKLKPDNPKLLKVMFHVGSYGKDYDLLNGALNAEELLFRCLQRQLVVLGTGHLDTLETTDKLLEVLDFPKRFKEYGRTSWESLTSLRIRRNKIFEVKDRLMREILSWEKGDDPELWRVIERVLASMMSDVTENKLRAKMLLEWMTCALICFHFVFSFPLAFVGLAIGALIAFSLGIVWFTFFVMYFICWDCWCGSSNENSEKSPTESVAQTLFLVIAYTLATSCFAVREAVFSGLLLPPNVLLAVYWLCTGSTFGAFFKPIHLFAPWLDYKYDWYNFRNDWCYCSPGIYRGEGLLFDAFMGYRDWLYMDYHLYIVNRTFPTGENWTRAFPFISYEI